MTVVGDYLRIKGCEVQELHHPRAERTIEEAEALGTPPERVLKTLLVLDRRGRHVLVVIPASRRVDMRLVRAAVGDQHAHLADEQTLGADFCGYELGALPPLGSLLGVDAIIDPEVLAHDVVVFAAGTQTDSIRMPLADLLRVERFDIEPVTEARHYARQRLLVGQRG
jgi:Ala-tRNA(Pro) deacylase